jgi:hypothetical protein
MGVFRCTQKLLKAMKVRPVSEPVPSTSRLGDWTANLVRLGRIQLVIAVSETTRLGVVIDAAPYARITEHFPQALFKALVDIGISFEDAAEESYGMESPQIASSNSRSVLATLNKFGAHVDFAVNRGVNSAAGLTSELAEYMMLQPFTGYPADRAREVFGVSRVERRMVLPGVTLH